MRLFICHVSEDKPFVDRLAEALRKQFDVWYDSSQLTLGDNLLQKITEGMLASDFGVVVLSKAFFAKKKWAENELGGLFALETETRKIILPVWKDVNEADVKSYSPILANKLAVSASQGLKKVVDEITLAVNVSQRKAELTTPPIVSKVKALAQTLNQRKQAQILASSEEGARIVSQGVIALFAAIERILNEAACESLKFGFSKPMQNILYVNTIHGMYLGLGVSDLHLNAVTNATLEVKIFKRIFGAFGEPHGDGHIFETRVFRPTFRESKLTWIEDGEEVSVCETEELAERLVEIFVGYVAKQAEA